MNGEILLNELRNRGFEVYLDDQADGDRTARVIRVEPPGGCVSEFALRQVEKYKEEVICILNQEEEIKALVCLVCNDVLGITSIEQKQARVEAALTNPNESISYYAGLAVKNNLYNGEAFE